MKLVVSGSPHVKSKKNTSFLMRDVLIGLLPAIGASLYFFRWRALILILTCVAAALLSEEIVFRMRKEKSTLFDYSAVVTGVLLALTLPPAARWYAGAIGTVFAIVVGKHVFGGLGSNIFNPALLGRAFIAAAYPTMITTYLEPGKIEAVSQATPLMLFKFNQQATALDKLFWGNIPGSLGETSAFCLLLGALYLLLRRVADWRIPASLLAAVALISTIGYLIKPALGPPFFHFLSGGLLLGTFFMATDPVTTPVTKKGRFIFGGACGVIIMILRYFSNLAEGVLYSILFLNALVPLINRYTRPKSFGRKNETNNQN